MKNEINNEQYEDALNNSDNNAIIEFASKSFRGVIPEDELNRCKLIALWESLQRWKPERGSKFTSFLYKKVKWECYKALNTLKKDKKHISLVEELTNCYEMDDFEELVDVLPDAESRQLIRQRFLDKMTLKEIGKFHGCSYETARKRINKAIKYLRESCIQN